MRRSWCFDSPGLACELFHRATMYRLSLSGELGQVLCACGQTNTVARRYWAHSHTAGPIEKNSKSTSLQKKTLDGELLSLVFCRRAHAEERIPPLPTVVKRNRMHHKLILNSVNWNIENNLDNNQQNLPFIVHYSSIACPNSYSCPFPNPSCPLRLLYTPPDHTLINLKEHHRLG